MEGLANSPMAENLSPCKSKFSNCTSFHVDSEFRILQGVA